MKCGGVGWGVGSMVVLWKWLYVVGGVWFVVFCWVRWVTVVHLVHGGLEEGYALSLVLLSILSEVQSRHAILQMSHSWA